MASVKRIEERLAVIEKSVERIVDQLKVLETLEKRVTECEERCKATDGEKECEDKISVSVEAISEASKQEIRKTNEDVISRIAVCEVKMEESVGKLERQITEVGDKTVALGVRLEELKKEEEFKKEFPTPAEAKSSAVKERTVDGSRMSCGEILKTTKDSVLVLGDSLVRGVGDKLRAQGGKAFDRVSKGGAKIESISDEIMKLEDDSKRHLVLIAGTNNLENDTTTDMLVKYDKLLENARKVKHGQVTVVGLVKRYDLRSSFETKRIVVNMKLREMCQKRHIEFLGYDPERRQMGMDRLHLNEEGQHELACRIFRHCLPFLG